MIRSSQKTPETINRDTTVVAQWEIWRAYKHRFRILFNDFMLLEVIKE